MTPAEILNFEDRCRGALVGMAVGDALGFPLRGLPPQAIAAMPELGEDFSPRPRGRYARGQFSDDTQVMLAVAESAILEKKLDGRSAASHIAWLWREGVLLQAAPALSESIDRILRGVPWMSAGAPVGTVDPSCLSRALVVGLWRAPSHGGDSARIAHDASVLTVLTHKDARCAAAAAAYARAVSLAFEPERRTPESFCEAVAMAASVHDEQLGRELSHLPRVLAWDEGKALSLLRKVAVTSAQLGGADGLPAHVTPVLLTTLYVALKIPHDFKAAMKFLLRAGGEIDVAAALLGGLLGAHLGLEAVPTRFRRGVVYADHLIDVATRLAASRQMVAVVTKASAVVRRR